MKFALASWGVRGDIEPCTAVGRELLRRGHEVRMAVPPDLVAFVEAAGAFARRVLTEGPADIDGRISFAFRAAVARKPVL